MLFEVNSPDVVGLPPDLPPRVIGRPPLKIKALSLIPVWSLPMIILPPPRRELLLLTPRDYESLVAGLGIFIFCYLIKRSFWFPCLIQLKFWRFWKPRSLPFAVAFICLFAKIGLLDSPPLMFCILYGKNPLVIVLDAMPIRLLLAIAPTLPRRPRFSELAGPPKPPLILMFPRPPTAPSLLRLIRDYLPALSSWAFGSSRGEQDLSFG